MPGSNASFRVRPYGRTLRAAGRAAALALALAAGLSARAQQDELHSQHAANPSALNPAATGANDALSVLAAYRHQWTGVQGAPRSALLQAHGTLANERLAFGLTLRDDRTGLTTRTSAMASYAYRLPAGEGHLALGLEAGAVFQEVAAAEAHVRDPDDPLVAANWRAVLPDLGFGVYFRDERFHAGLAARHLTESRFADGRLLETEASRLRRHLYAHGGVRIPVAEPVELRPSVLLKAVAGAPFQAEFDLSARFLERFWAGANVRTGGSVDLHAALHPTPTTRVGYAYDWVFGGLAPYTGGSHEVFLQWDLHLRGQAPAPGQGDTPRFF